MLLLDNAVNTTPNIFHSFISLSANHLFFGRFLLKQIEVGILVIRKHNNYKFLFDIGIQNGTG